MKFSPFHRTAVFYNAQKLGLGDILEEDENGILMKILGLDLAYLDQRDPDNQRTFKRQ